MQGETTACSTNAINSKRALHPSARLTGGGWEVGGGYGYTHLTIKGVVFLRRASEPATLTASQDQLGLLLWLPVLCNAHEALQTNMLPLQRCQRMLAAGTTIAEER